MCQHPTTSGASPGQRPSNQALLDYLALSFTENGWSVKKLIRTLVLSRAYQQSSQFDAGNYELDPDNVLVWRMSRRRLEAEPLRDAMLALSGRLDLTPPVGTTVARGGEGPINLAFRGRGIDSVTAESCRTVYLPVVRDLLPESLTLFDFPDPTLMAGERATNDHPGRSRSYLMNNPFVIRQAELVADRLLEGTGSDADKM